ncbi:MAG: lipopolysaccharide biosynthesis protein, partial [Blastocatellia bacterium]
GTTLAASVIIWRLGPKFTSIRRFIGDILLEIKRYGFNAYLARITATTSTRLDSLIVTYFLGAGPLGLYFSAQKFTSPIATMSRSLAITRFRKFTRASVVPARITRWNAILLFLASGSIAAFGPVAIRLLFPKYAAAGAILPPLALMNLFQGLFQPYNIFLASHGRGADLRNVAIVFTVTSVVALFALVPRFGVIGAAWAGVIAMAADYGLHYYYYRRLRAKLGGPPQHQCAQIANLTTDPPAA